MLILSLENVVGVVEGLTPLFISRTGVRTMTSRHFTVFIFWGPSEMGGSRVAGWEISVDGAIRADALRPPMRGRRRSGGMQGLKRVYSRNASIPKKYFRIILTMLDL